MTSPRPLPSSSSATRRRMASSTAISFAPDQLPPEPTSSTPPHTSFTHLTSRDILNADPTSTPGGGSAGTLAPRLDPYGVPQLDEPDHIYMPVSTVVGRVYRRVPREQALRLLAGDGGNAESEWNVGPGASVLRVSDKDRTPLAFVFQVWRLSVGMVRLVPLILLGMTAMETLLTCTQPIAVLGPLVQVYSAIARPLAIIFDTLLTLLVVIRIVLLATFTRTGPFTIHPAASSPIPSSGSLLEHASLFPPDVNKPPRRPPSRLATLLYFLALISSSVTFPFADDLDIARNARARGAGATWAGSASLARWLVGGQWTELPKGWSAHVLVWWVAGIVRMGMVAGGFVAEVVVKARGRRGKVG